MKTEIQNRFNGNLERVEHLVALYDTLTTGPGRRPVDTSDILRSAVVFLHASLEDFLRSLLEWKLPSAQASYLKDISLTGKKPRTSFTLDDLAHFRGTNVDDLISRSIAEHLERSNFNNPGEVGSVLESIGLMKSLLDPYRDKLGPMMKRRHWIVHRADRNNATGSGQHAALGLQKATVEAWTTSVRNFGTSVLSQI
jgi:hypothetical protein